MESEIVFILSELDRCNTALNFAIMCLITLMMYHLKLTLMLINSPYEPATGKGYQLSQIERRQFWAQVCTVVSTVTFFLLINVSGIYDYFKGVSHATDVVIGMPVYLVLLVVYSFFTFSLLKQVRLIRGMEDEKRDIRFQQMTFLFALLIKESVLGWEFYLVIKGG